MKRKRDKSLSKSETEAHNESPKKQIKKDFTEIEFKVMIKDPNTTFAGTRVHNNSIINLCHLNSHQSLRLTMCDTVTHCQSESDSDE